MAPWRGLAERVSAGEAVDGRRSGIWVRRASEAFFTKEAAEIAKGLELPCPKDSEPRPVYIARMISSCHSTVKGAFPVMSWFYPALPPTACRLAGIEARANNVLLDIESCKVD